jgi:hypothetical protein
MLELTDIRNALRSQLHSAMAMPSHVAAFCGWIAADAEQLRRAIDESINFTGQARHPEHVAALGFGAHAGLLSTAQLQILLDEVHHLGGRAFFSPGRPPRFEVDGIALLGVSLGTARVLQRGDGAWLHSLLQRSSEEVMSDPWQLGLIRLARLAVGEQDLRIVPPDLAVAATARGLGKVQGDDREQAWKMVVGLLQHDSGPARDAARLATFEFEISRLGEVNLATATRDDLVRLLQGLSRGMKRWTFEKAKRTPRSEIAKWQIDNEYHVQNLLWAVLAPVFPDLEDEENLPSVGHMHPRADLGIPSLRTIIEVKFLRQRGQSGFTRIIEEVAADTSLYLSRITEYDNIVAFLWDDCAQTEQHHELKSGIERIRGISAAIILSRPSCMLRNTPSSSQAA